MEGWRRSRIAEVIDQNQSIHRAEARGLVISNFGVEPRLSRNAISAADHIVKHCGPARLLLASQ